MPALAGTGTAYGVVEAIWGSRDCTDAAIAERKWTTAARIALMPVSSSSGEANTRWGCDYPHSAVSFPLNGRLNGNRTVDVTSGVGAAMHAMACYAFEPGNITVEVDWDNTALGVAAAGTVPPITSTVTFRMPVISAVAGIFADGERSDGTFYRTLTAEATLL